MNWTHKDRLGRVQVPVGVAYGSDTEKVRDILLACAKAHPDVMSWPAPYVVFMDFGASSLDFQLRAFLRNVENRLTVASDLRFAVDKAFREAGVEIPFPQRDLHLKGMDRLEQALAALAPAGRTGGGASVVPLRGPAPGARDDATDPDPSAKDKPTGGGRR
jgi:small-conductance mechanosensitive channel